MLKKISIKPNPALQAPANPAKILKLAPSPMYVEDGKTLVWEEGIDLFYNWMLVQFGSDMFAAYQVAERLDVHRYIADEWSLGLSSKGYVIESQKSVLNYASLDDDVDSINVFALVDPVSIGFKAVRGVVVDTDGLNEYDPWESREYDDQIPDAICPDLIVDKFYDPFVNEHMIMTRKVRIKENGKLFQPMSRSEHPRYDTSEASKQYKIADWRRIIDEKTTASDD